MKNSKIVTLNTVLNNGAKVEVIGIGKKLVQCKLTSKSGAPMGTRYFPIQDAKCEGLID